MLYNPGLIGKVVWFKGRRNPAIRGKYTQKLRPPRKNLTAIGRRRFKTTSESENCMGKTDVKG